MTAYNLCTVCGERDDRPQHHPWNIERHGGHTFASPRHRDPSQRIPIRTFSRPEAYAAGFVDSDDPRAKAPEVGDEAIVYARGDLRLGIVSKIGRTTVYVDVATPTSPDLVTKGKIGGRWNERGLYRAVEPLRPCGNRRPYNTTRDTVGPCYLPEGHAGSHEGTERDPYAFRGIRTTRWSNS